ncbi:MAG: hypothetical protein LBS45_02340 [Synergistaceae bacterium]|jgi:ABC-2 type transport system permease protein|nr:hypothetical protein [Synergistaceae bacterium]
MYFFAIALKNSLLYRKGVFFSFFGSFIFIAVNMMLWRALFKNDHDSYSYMVRYTIVSNIVSTLYSRKIAEFVGKKISTGEFAADIARPVNFFVASWAIELANICSRFMLCGVPVILVFLPFLFSGIYFNIGFFVLSVFMGHVFSILLYSLIGLGAFILVDVRPFRHLLDDTIRLLGGAFIPIVMLPSPIGEIASVLPFRFLYSFQLEMLLTPVDMARIAEGYCVLLLWIGLLAIMNISLCGLVFERSAAQG